VGFTQQEEATEGYQRKPKVRGVRLGAATTSEEKRARSAREIALAIRDMPTDLLL